MIRRRELEGCLDAYLEITTEIHHLTIVRAADRIQSLENQLEKVRAAARRLYSLEVEAFASVDEERRSISLEDLQRAWSPVFEVLNDWPFEPPIEPVRKRRSRSARGKNQDRGLGELDPETNRFVKPQKPN